MNRLLTLTTGGLFAAMAILPVAAFAAGSATSGTETKPHAAMTTPAPADSKAAVPATEAKGDMKGHKVETKTEAKGDAVKHDGAVKTPAGQSSVQPKPVEPGKS